MKKRFIMILTLVALLITLNSAAAAPKVAGLFFEANDLVYTNYYVNQSVGSAFERTGDWSIFDWVETDVCHREADLWLLNQPNKMCKQLEDLPNTELQKLFKKIGLDYAVILFIDNDEGDLYEGAYRDTFTVVVETNLKVFDVNKGEYILSEVAIAEGRNNSTYISVPSVSRAYVDGVIKSMSKIRVDTYALR